MKIIPKCLIACLSLGLCLILFQTQAFSQVTFTYVDSFQEGGFQQPRDIAISSNGTIVIADGGLNRILIFNSAFVLIKSIPVAKPSAVALNSDGNLYIASDDDNGVRILDSSFNSYPIGWLGIGNGEFLQASNITIDKITRQVYVTDQKDNSIKYYSPAGEYLGKISNSLTGPQDATIVENEIFVIDHPLIIPKENSAPIAGSRIQAFDLNDPSRVRSLGNYGEGTEDYHNPLSIVSDSLGYLFVSDAFHNVVQCFDQEGNYITSIHNIDYPLGIPTSLVVNNSERMFVLSLSQTSSPSDMKMFDLAGTPADMIDPFPDIKANDKDGPLSLCSSDAFNLSIFLDAGDWESEAGDHLVVSNTPVGEFWYADSMWIWSDEWTERSLAMRTGILTSNTVGEQIYTGTGLEPGTYIFYYAVDTTMNDNPLLRGLFYDSVTVIIKSAQDCAQ